VDRGPDRHPGGIGQGNAPAVLNALYSKTCGRIVLRAAICDDLIFDLAA